MSEYTQEEIEAMASKAMDKEIIEGFKEKLAKENPTLPLDRNSNSY